MRNTLYWLLGGLLLLGALGVLGGGGGPARAAGPGAVKPGGCPPAGTPTAVAWTNAGNVDGGSPTLQKVGGGNAWNGGAISTLAITSGDGYVQWTVADTTNYVVAGLGQGDSSQAFGDVDYGFYTYALSNTLQVVENGVLKTLVGPYVAGDQLTVSLESGTVFYYQNCGLVYTSTVTPAYPLVFDDSLFNLNARVVSAAIGGANLLIPPTPTVAPTSVTWLHLIGSSAAGNTLTKTGATGWNAGAVSSKAIGGGDGAALFTIADTGSYFMAGLGLGDSDVTYPDIDYAFYAYAGSNTLLVYENGVYKKSVGGYAAGDVLRVAAESGAVNYYRNGGKVYTSAAAPGYPLLLDTSLYTNGAQVSNAQLAAANLVNVTSGLPLAPTPVAWKNGVNVISATSTLTKTTGGGAWNAGAVSDKAIPAGADGYVQSTVADTTHYLMFGLSNGDTTQHFTDIDFAFYLNPAGPNLGLYEGGVYKSAAGAYAAGDVLRVEVAGGVVRYYRNGTLLYTSAVAPSQPLLLDTSLYTPGGQVKNAQIAGSSLAPSKPAPPGTLPPKPGRPVTPPHQLPPGSGAP